MTSLSLDAEVLLATLASAEAQLRNLATQALPPGAAFRVERVSTERAHDQVGDLHVEEHLSLPAGWAEFVEVDDAIDALLARLVTPDTPLEIELRTHDAEPEVPELPAEVTHARPADAASGDAAPQAKAKAPPRVGYDDTPLDTQGIRVGYGEPTEDLAEADPSADDPYAGPEGTGYVSYAPSGEEEAPTETWSAYGDEDGAYADDGYADEGYADEGYDHGAYEEGYDEGYEEAPVEAATPEQPPEDDLGFGQHDWAGEDGAGVGRIDPYAHMGGGDTDRVVSLEDIGGDAEEGTGVHAREGAEETETAVHRLDQVLASTSVEYDDEGDLERYDDPDHGDYEDYGDNLLDDAVEQTAAELTMDLPGDDADWGIDEDEDAEPTQILEGPALDPARAAVQLHADGSADILGAEDVEDEPSEVSAIALAADLDDDDEDDLGAPGGFGVDIVEYEEVEVEPLDDDVDDGHTMMTHQGAPQLSPKEIDGLERQAHAAARRDMAMGVQLYGDVLDADPDRVSALLARGRLHLDLGDYGRAVSDFLKAEDRDPTAPDVHVGLGDLFFNRKDYRKAIGHYDRALEHDPEHAQALYRRGLGHYYRKQYADAIADLQRAKDLDASLHSVDTYLDRARRRRG